MKVSVVMCNYHRRQFLKYSLHALSLQSKKVDEVVIMNDDGLGDIEIEREFDFDIKQVNIPDRKDGEYRTSAYAFNQGILQATGDVVIIVSPETIMGERNVEIICEQIEKDKLAFVTSMRFFFQQRDYIIPENTKYNLSMIYLEKYDMWYPGRASKDHELVLQDNMVHGIYGSLRKNWVELGGFDLKMAIWGKNDWDLNQRIKHSKYHHVFTSQVWGIHLWHERDHDRQVSE